MICGSVSLDHAEPVKSIFLPPDSWCCMLARMKNTTSNMVPTSGPDADDRREWARCAHAPWFGLTFRKAGLQETDRQLLHAWLESILLVESSVQDAAAIWKFVVDDDGAVREVTQDPDLDPVDTPNRFRFDEVYDHLHQQLARLSIGEQPPVRKALDEASWQRAVQRIREVDAYSSTLKGRLQSLLAGVGLASPVERPPLPRRIGYREQADLLQDWIDRHLQDGSLLAAIESSHHQSRSE